MHSSVVKRQAAQLSCGRKLQSPKKREKEKRLSSVLWTNTIFYSLMFVFLCDSLRGPAAGILHSGRR